MRFKKALLIVDLQNDFCPKGRLAVREAVYLIDGNLSTHSRFLFYCMAHSYSYIFADFLLSYIQPFSLPPKIFTPILTIFAPSEIPIR